MPRTDPGLPLVAAIAAVSWAAAGAAALMGIAPAAAVLAAAPAVVAAYRDRRLGMILALAGAVVYAAIAAMAGTPVPEAALGAVTVAGLGLLVAATIGTAAGEAAAYRIWYHGLRDRLPAATLFFMPATGRVYDLNGRALDLLGPLKTRSFAEAFADPDAYATFAADLGGEVAGRGVWLRGADGVPHWCELSGAMATPVLAVVSIADRTAARVVADALAASEAAYRTLVANAPGAALLVDEDLRIAAAGGEAVAALSGSDEPVAGRTLWTAFPDRVAQAIEPLARLAAFGTPGTAELELDGRRLLLAAAPVPGDDATVAGAALTATDVTALAVRLGECEERRSIAVGLLAVHRADGTSAAERLLDAALRLTGSRYGAVLRVEDAVVVPLAVSPALADTDLAVLAGDAAAARVPAVREETPDAPLPLRRILAVPAGKDGVVAVADRPSPYTDRAVARVRELADGGFDIAVRSATAAETAARADAFEALLTGAPLPLLLTGRDGEVQLENDAARALFGEGAAETLALRIAGPDRNRVATTEERRRRAARGVPSRYRAAVLDANGETRPCLIASAYRRRNETTLFAFLDLGPAAAFDRCRDRALGALEARLERALDAGGEDPDAFVEAVRAAWRASARERGVLAAPTPFEALPEDCGNYS